MPGEAEDEAQVKKLQLELDYASGWFQYTASQRLTTFNFFLVVVGFVLVAYAQAIDHRWRCFGAGIGAIGAVVSMGFLAIDVRNEVLVDKGLFALRKIEAGLRIGLADPALDRLHLDLVLRESRPGRLIAQWISHAPETRWRLFTYRVWFRSVITFIGVAFFVGTVWAVCDFPGS